MVMYLGRVAESADADTLYSAPRHPYTRALMAAVPVPEPERRAADVAVVRGDVPSPLAPPSGCAFRTRCPMAVARCAEETPKLRQVGDTAVACHLVDGSVPEPSAP